MMVGTSMLVVFRIGSAVMPRKLISVGAVMPRKLMSRAYRTPG